MAIQRTGPDFNPGNARWCDEHGRLECTKNRTKGRGPCHKIAIRGTAACDFHSGYSRAVAKAQGEARITAWSPTGPSTIDASSAVLGVLQMTHLRLAAYAELLRRQVVTEGTEAGSTSEDDPQSSGLIGMRYGMGGKEGILYAQSEEVRALVILEGAERDRVVKYAKTAHDMGISSKLISMAERWGDIVAGRIALVLEGLALSEEQSALVPRLLDSHLGSVDLAAISATPEE